MSGKKSRKITNMKELNCSEDVRDESSSSESDSAISTRVTRSKSKIKFSHTRSGRYYTLSKVPHLPLNAYNKKEQLNKNTRKSTRQSKSLKVKKKNSRSRKATDNPPTEQVLETSLPDIESGMNFSEEIQTENSVSDFSYKTSTLVQGEVSISRKLELPNCPVKSLPQSKIKLHNKGIDQNEEDVKDLHPIENNEILDTNASNYLNEIIKCVSIDKEYSNALFSSNTESDLLYNKQQKKLNNLKDEETDDEHNIVKLDKSRSVSSEVNIEDSALNLSGDSTEKLDCNKSHTFGLSEEKSSLSKEPSLNIIKTHSKIVVEASTAGDNTDELKKVNIASNLCDRSIVLSNALSIKVNNSLGKLNNNTSEIVIPEYEEDTPGLPADVTGTVSNERDDKEFEKDHSVSKLLIEKANEEQCFKKSINNPSESNGDFTSEYKSNAVPIIMSNQEENITSLTSEDKNDIIIHGSCKSEPYSYVSVSNKHTSDCYLHVEKESENNFDECDKFFHGLQDLNDYNSSHSNSMLLTSITKDTVEVPSKYGRHVELDKNNFHSPKSRKGEMSFDENTESDAALDEFNGVQLENNNTNSGFECNKNLENRVGVEHCTTNRGETNFNDFSYKEKIAIDVLSHMENSIESGCQNKQEFGGTFIGTEKSSDGKDQLKKFYNGINLELNQNKNPVGKQSDVESSGTIFAVLKSNASLGNLERNQYSNTTKAKSDFQLCKKHNDNFSIILENQTEISCNFVKSPGKNNAILSTITEKDTIKDKNLSENGRNSLESDLKITEHKYGNNYLMELSNENVGNIFSTELRKDAVFEDTCSSSKLSSQEIENKEIDASYTESGQESKELIITIDQSEEKISQKMIDSSPKLKLCSQEIETIEIVANHAESGEKSKELFITIDQSEEKISQKMIDSSPKLKLCSQEIETIEIVDNHAESGEKSKELFITIDQSEEKMSQKMIDSSPKLKLCSQEIETIEIVANDAESGEKSKELFITIDQSEEKISQKMIDSSPKLKLSSQEIETIEIVANHAESGEKSEELFITLDQSEEKISQKMIDSSPKLKLCSQEIETIEILANHAESGEKREELFITIDQSEEKISQKMIDSSPKLKLCSQEIETIEIDAESGEKSKELFITIDQSEEKISQKMIDSSPKLKLRSQEIETEEIDATYPESGEESKELFISIDQSEGKKFQKMIDSLPKLKFKEYLITKQVTFEKSDKMFDKSDFKKPDEKDKIELLKSEDSTVISNNEELAEKEIGACLIKCSEMDNNAGSHEESKSLHFSQEIYIIPNSSPDSSENCRLYKKSEMEHCEVLLSGDENNMLDNVEVENRKVTSNVFEKDEAISLSSVFQNAETDCAMNLISQNEVTDCGSGEFCEKVNKFIISNKNNLSSKSQKVIDAELNLQPFIGDEQSSVLVEQVVIDNNLKLTSACQKDKETCKIRDDLPKSYSSELPEKDMIDYFLCSSNDNNVFTSEQKDNVISLSDEIILITDDNDHRSLNETVLEIHEGELKRDNDFPAPNDPIDLQPLSLNCISVVTGQENTGSTRSDVFLKSSERSNCSLNLALEISTHKELSRDFEERDMDNEQRNVNQTRKVSVRTDKLTKEYILQPRQISKSTSLKLDDKSKKSASIRHQKLPKCSSGKSTSYKLDDKSKKSASIRHQKLSKCSRGSRNYRDSQKLDMNSSYLHVLNRICEEVQQEMANSLKEDNEIDWHVKVELLFLYDMIGYKPVGVNRHFMMLLIHNKFSTHINHQISSKVLWNHLDSMYDMAALHESEINPFPNDEVEFELPEECHELLRTKCGVILKRSNSENEANKNSANSKASKKLAPKLKQSSTPVGTPKSNVVSSVLYKPTKNQVSVKSESKTSNSDLSSKSKQELGLSTKMNKIKRSSSPFTGKTVKSESISVTKEDSPDISLNKKGNKTERGSSPATVKKTIKVEPNVGNNSAKKPSKTEPSVNGSKPVKTETPDNSVKKIKVDVLNKKSKVASSAEITSKKIKVDINGIKKKVDENTPKKASEISSTKQIKTEVKSSSQPSKGTELESSASSGSRKSSPVVKVKSSDSSKKLKRPRVEESSKKLTPTPKRRRL